MPNFEVIGQKYPSGGDPAGTERLIFVDDGDGTFTFTVADGDGTYPSVAAAISAGSNVKVFGIVGGAGGSNTQVQFNNAGNLGGVAGATSDGTNITFGSTNLRINNLYDSSGNSLLLFAVNPTNQLFIGTNGTGNPGVATGTQDVAIGPFSMTTLTSGGENTAVGSQALRHLTTGSNNVAIGKGALATSQTGASSVAVGQNALNANNGANQNVAIGGGALAANTSGNTNVALGTQAGVGNLTGSGNLFLGDNAGANELGSNKLYIANTNTATPLIGGDFAAQTITLGGQLGLLTGTASLAPLKFTSGTNLTSAAAGALEFDGVQFYHTIDTTSGRGAAPVEQYFHLTANGGAITSIANFFGANSNIALVPNAHYEIEMWLWFVTTGTGADTITLTNSAAPASQNIYWEESPATGVVAPPGTATMLFGQTLNDATAAKAITTASLSAATHFIHIRIWLINGNGTNLKIQATAGGTNLTPQIGSWWKCTRRSPNNIGTFAA